MPKRKSKKLGCPVCKQTEEPSRFGCTEEKGCKIRVCPACGLEYSSKFPPTKKHFVKDKKQQTCLFCNKKFKDVFKHLQSSNDDLHAIVCPLCKKIVKIKQADKHFISHKVSFKQFLEFRKHLALRNNLLFFFPDTIDRFRAEIVYILGKIEHCSFLARKTKMILMEIKSVFNEKQVYTLPKLIAVRMIAGEIDFDNDLDEASVKEIVIALVRYSAKKGLSITAKSTLSKNDLSCLGLSYEISNSLDWKDTDDW